MPERHNLKDHLTHPVFKKIGCVSTMKDRDLCCWWICPRCTSGRKREVFDVDIVTVGSGIDLATKVAAALHPGLKVNVFRNFGTAMFRFCDIDFEFVGARRESYRHESASQL